MNNEIERLIDAFDDAPSDRVARQVGSYMKDYMRALQAEFSQSVKDVLTAGLSTGHADSYLALITELRWQVVESRDRIAELEKERDDARTDLRDYMRDALKGEDDEA